MPSGIDPTVDYAFKRLFGHETTRELLVDLLNAVHAGKRVRDVTLRNPFSGKASPTDKATIYDICATDQGGRQHHVEMQKQVQWSLRMRAIYYAARLHGQQMAEGDVFETLLPTLSVCFLGANLLDDPAYHHRFALWDHERGVLLAKDLEIHLIELAKFDLPAEKCRTPLEQWCYFLRHGATLDLDKLPAALDVPMLRKALEVLMKLSQDQIERQQYEDRIKGQRDAAWLVRAPVVARKQGELLGKINLAQRVLKLAETPDQELLELSSEELAALA